MVLFVAAAAIIPVTTFLILDASSSSTEKLTGKNKGIDSYMTPTANLGDKENFIYGCMALGFVMSGYLKHDAYTITIAAPVLLTTMLCSQIRLIERSGEIKSGIQYHNAIILGSLLNAIGAVYSEHYCK